MNLEQLRSFLMVAKTGHFTNAAAELHVAQPTLSRHIATLEAELGLELFNRARGNVTLTAAGETLLPIASRMIADAEHIHFQMQELSGLRRGRVRLGAPPSMCVSVVARSEERRVGKAGRAGGGEGEGRKRETADGRREACVERCFVLFSFFFFQAEDGIRDGHVTGVQTCALPISGETLLPIASRMIADAEHIHFQMQELSGLRRGRVRLGAPPSMCVSVVAEVLGPYNQHYPGVELHLRESGSHQLLNELVGGTLDLALVVASEHDPSSAESLEHVPLLFEELVVISAQEQ